MADDQAYSPKYELGADDPMMTMFMEDEMGIGDAAVPGGQGANPQGAPDMRAWPKIRIAVLSSFLDNAGWERDLRERLIAISTVPSVEDLQVVLLRAVDEEIENIIRPSMAADQQPIPVSPVHKVRNARWYGQLSACTAQLHIVECALCPSYSPEDFSRKVDMVLNRRRVASVNRRPRVPQGRSSIVSPPGIHLNDIVPEGITSVYLPPDEAAYTPKGSAY